MLEGVHKPAEEVTAEHGGLGGGIPLVVARLGTEVHDLTVRHDQGDLPLVDRDDRAVCDDVLGGLIARAEEAALLGSEFALGHKDVVIQRIAGEIFAPLVGHYGRGAVNQSSDKSHNLSP